MRIISVSQDLLVLIIITIFGSSLSAVVGKDGTYATLIGSSLTLTCVPKEMLNGLNEIGTSYSWTNAEGKEVINARFTVQKNGDLEIVNTHIGDSGIYKCKFHPSSEKPDSETPSKLYEHKLLVYELAGHKFVTTVTIDVSTYSREVILNLLKDLFVTMVCRQDLCAPMTIKSLKCETLETKTEYCVFSLPYEAFNQIADEKCDEDCVRQKMFDGLKKAEKILEAELLKMSEDPRARIKADMRTFDTRHLITCHAGFHLVKAHFKRCFPCLPGYYSESNSVTCNLCKIGYFQEHYGKQKCDRCEDGKTTDTMGSKSRDECVSQEGYGVLNNIKRGLADLFIG